MKTIQLTIRRPQQVIGGGVPVETQLLISFNMSSLQQGKDDEIERFVKEETAKALPLVQDKELMRFRLKPESSRVSSFQPSFINSEGKQENAYAAAGFSYDQVRTLSQGLARSIYIFEIFDTPDPDTQRLLSRSFAKGNDLNTYTPVTGGTKGLVTGNTPFIQFIDTTGRATMLSDVALPMYLVKSAPTGTVYMRIAFFNAATGKRVLFRQSTNALSLVDKKFIALTYDATTRQYQLPIGTSITMEEVPAAQTQADAEQERQKRLNNLDTSFTLGTFEPLGKKVFTGSTANETSDTETTTGITGTTTSGILTIVVPNTVVTTISYTTAEAAASIPPTTSASGVYTKSGILSIGASVYFNTGGRQQLTDGYYAYVLNATLPVKVLRISGGNITELDIKTQAATNTLKAVPNTEVCMTVRQTEYEGCAQPFTGDIRQLYTESGSMSIGALAYASSDRTSQLTDGYYSYKTGVPAYYLVLAIYQGKIADTNVPCNFGSDTDTGSGGLHS